MRELHRFPEGPPGGPYLGASRLRKAPPTEKASSKSQIGPLRALARIPHAEPDFEVSYRIGIYIQKPEALKPKRSVLS